MKKFLIISMLLLAVGFGIWYCIYYMGFYLPLSGGGAVTADFSTQGKEILIKSEDGTWVPVALKGVDVSASIPGQPASMFAAGEADYLRWLEQIGQMGANTVRVYTIMDSDFYNAFYTYNTTHDMPLYLMQGILVSDEANYSGTDAYQENFLGKLLSDGKSAVDIIHGRKNIFSSKFGGTNFYRKDISPWVLGYLVGNEWSADTIAYTDHSTDYSPGYAGIYFQTAPDATIFETMLAQVMDQIIGYESWKYQSQRLIGFISAPDIDFLVYQDIYARQLSKYCYTNAENILPTESLKSGYFAAYQLFDFCDEFVDYLEESQVMSKDYLTAGLKTDVKYGGYLELLDRYHTVPMIAFFGISSSRGVLMDDQIPLTEAEQGESLMDIYLLARKNNWAGGYISTWQDVWEKRNWNTGFATELTRNSYWHDLQSDGQNNGLMAFDPGKEERVCVIDGDSSEWSSEHVVLQQKNGTLSVKMDAEGIYLLIEAENAQNKDWILPIDTTQESGSLRCAGINGSFQREADFVLLIDGKDNSRILVSEYYDPVRMNFLQQVTGRDPFVSSISPDTHTFLTATIAVKNTTLKTLEQYREVYHAEKIYELELWETGLLHYGCGDPLDPRFDSLSDFCFGEDVIEVRIPWQLLNFSDPSEGLIHLDYYKEYGVASKSIRHFWIGLSQGEDDVRMSMVKLHKWGENPLWHERLKQSYYVVQSVWKEE